MYFISHFLYWKSSFKKWKNSNKSAADFLLETIIFIVSTVYKDDSSENELISLPDSIFLIEEPS
jgi:hypothetical protein